MNLVESPWLPVVTAAGGETWSLRTVFSRAAEVVTVGAGDPVADAALMRLLIAVDSAAADAAMAPGDWLEAHRDRFDLFSESAPFGQSAAVRDTGLWRGVPVLVVGAAADSSTYYNRDHLASGMSLPVEQAAVELLVRNGFGPSGKQPFPAGPFGPNASNGKTAAAANRAVTWLEGSTLADTLPLNRVSGGSFCFGWPDGVLPGSTLECDGPIAALTWPSRALALQPSPSGDDVVGAMCAHGSPYPQDSPDLTPGSVWIHSDADGWASQGVSTKALTWLRVAEALLAEQTAGILARARALPFEQRAGVRLRVGGLATFQAKIMGREGAVVPLPVSAEAEEAMRQVAARTRRIAKDVTDPVRRAARATDTTLPDTMTEAAIATSVDAVRASAGRILDKAAAGAVGVADVDRLFDAQIAAQHARIAADLVAAGYVRAGGYLSRVGAPEGERTYVETRAAAPVASHADPEGSWETLWRRVLASQHAGMPAHHALRRWTPGTLDSELAALLPDAPEGPQWQGWLGTAALRLTHAPAPDSGSARQARHAMASATTFPEVFTAARRWADATARIDWAALAAELAGWCDERQRPLIVARWADPTSHV